ncbi:MAG TPA: hypothetical protein VK907_01510 [Phnomibacter sp.]|nr:hypothetical protein [Phnomibacter sp.]
MTSACVPLGSVLPWLGRQQDAYTGSAFYKQASAYNWQQRDSLALEWLLAGRVPSFMARFKKVEVSITDSASGNTIKAHYFVSPDYVSIGTDNDWARLPLTPMAAQRLADSLHCFLPTRKMVDDIYQQATVKLEPMPMYAFRDSTPTMYHHHLIIEGQRRGRTGLIAGIKKDVVLSNKVLRDERPDRVAIYGWHKLDGKPIQPLYTGHVNWYVDYSHGIRLIQQTIYVNKRPMHYTEVLKHPVYHRLLCDEPSCDHFRY